RTCQTPTTPSDVGHLLPPIGDRKPRRHHGDHLPPVPPHTEPPLPRPAPVHCNISGLYDPALDPSPIGEEERGKVQPVRISRIVPSWASSAAAQESKGVGRSRVDADVATVVTVLNGCKTRGTFRHSVSTCEGWANAAGSDDEDNCLDIFVEGFSRGIDHATLFPSEIFCRELQNGGRGISKTPRLLLGEAGHSSDVSESYLGLTILLARAGEWFQTAAQGAQNEQDGEVYEGASDHSIDGHAWEATVTRLIFQRADGTPGPSQNAFRVQFEPGPLGVELEEHPSQRGIVQIRRVLQAGQAELDGRLSAGCLTVAVGNWDEHRAISPPPPTRDGDPGATFASDVADIDTYGSLDITNTRLRAVNGTAGAEKDSQVVIRSLAEIEEAISRRGCDRLFVLWVLDRQAPEAIAALGRPEADSACSAPRRRQRSTRSIFTACQSEGNEGVEGPFPSAKRGERTLKSSSTSILTGPGSLHLQAVKGMLGAPGWDSGLPLPRGNGSLEYSLSSNENEAIASERGLTGPGAKRAGGEVQPGAGLLQSTLKSPDEVTGERMSKFGRGGGLDWASRKEETCGNRREKVGVESTVGWEFETGGGIFDEDDQGLAPRKHPREKSPSRIADEEVPPPFPLGLQASIMDEVAVFIWFCNNHESATMKVSWIDYDGKRVARRSLAPGSCYFERSFATHPWVIQHDDSNDRGETQSLHHEDFQSRFRQQQQPQYQASGKEESEHDEECCVVRLGDAMSLGRFTGSLIWNPTGRTLSITKQAKVGVPGMSAAAHAAVGSDTSDGAGLDPGMKRLCMAGPRREAEEARAKTLRAIVRGEKIRTLQEMKTWRIHPSGGTGADMKGRNGQGGDGGCGVAESGVGGLGQGVPNLRVIMMGSSSLNYGE
ncbi:unnamed protein product, partial [Scytosiphon promiscuus]